MITVFPHPDGRLRLSFAYDKATVDALHVFGDAIVWHKGSRVWLLEANQFDKLLRHFGPKLAIHPDVWMTAPTTAPGQSFAEALAGMGVTLVDRDGHIVAEGEGVSPALQAAVTARTRDLRRYAMYVPERVFEGKQGPPAGAVRPLEAPPAAENDAEWQFLQTLKKGQDRLRQKEISRRELIDRAKAQRQALRKAAQGRLFE